MFVQLGLAVGLVFTALYWVDRITKSRSAWRTAYYAVVAVILLGVFQAAPLILTFTPQNGQRVMYLDHKECQSYQWLDEDWKCVPWEEAG